MTSVLTCPDWLDLDCPLTAGHDRLTHAGPAARADVPLDAGAAGAAAQRLAETLVAGTRFVDMPLYRLTDIRVGKGEIGGSLGITPFASYALTLDLLEGELADALAAGIPPEPGSLPLRDRYLPDLASVLGVAGRLCAGGALALCAFARPADPYRGPADYALLVQERSSSVVNATRQLAVIPKGFHQPLADFCGDAKIAATLRREMEEELFGREDIDNTVGEQHAADPLHPSRLSAPMRWLLENPARSGWNARGSASTWSAAISSSPALSSSTLASSGPGSAARSRRAGNRHPCVSTPAWTAGRWPRSRMTAAGATRDCLLFFRAFGGSGRSAGTG